MMKAILSGLRLPAGIVTSLMLLLFAQFKVEQGVEDGLREAKAELQAQSLESIFDAKAGDKTFKVAVDNQQSEAVAAGNLALSAQGNCGADHAVDTDDSRQSMAPWAVHWWLFLKGVWRASSAMAMADERASNSVTVHTSQASLPVEDFGMYCRLGDPVLPNTGEMSFTHPVVSVPGSGLPFTFVLSYRSGYGYNGPVGYGWEHNYNARFLEDGSGNLTLYQGNRQDIYQKSGATYTNPAGMFDLSITKVTGTPDRVERVLRDGTTQVYEAVSATGYYFLSQVKHRNTANTIDLYYDSTDRLTRINDTRSADFKLVYAAIDNRITRLQDWSSGGGLADREWSFKYDLTSGDLTSLDRPGGGSKRLTYVSATTSSCRLLATVKDPREFASFGAAYLEMTYDSQDRVSLQQMGVSGQEYQFTYGTNKVTLTDRENNNRIYSMDGALGAVTKIDIKDGATTYSTLYGWDSSSELITKVTLPEGNGILYEYDGSGNLVVAARCTASGLGSTPSRASSDYLITEFSYQTESGWDLLTKIVDPENNGWQLTRDAKGNVTQVKTPEHAADPWVISYDSKSHLISVVDPESRKTEFKYGAVGLLTEVIQDPATLALSTEYKLDVFGRVTKILDGLGRGTTYARDDNDLVTKITTHESRVTDLYYDENDQLTKMLADNDNADVPNSRAKLEFSYDILDRLTQKKEYYGTSYASSRVWAYEYDQEERLTSVELPEGNEVAYTYDARGLLLTRTMAEGATEEFDAEILSYDDNGRISVRKDGLGNSSTFTFDGFDRRVTSQDPTGALSIVVYDKNSNVVTSGLYKGTDTFSQTIVVYDDDGLRVTQKKLAKDDGGTNLGGGSGWVESTYEYDKAGLLLTVVDSCGCGGAGGDMYYVYDAASRLVTKEDEGGNQAIKTYDDAGQVIKTTSKELMGSVDPTYVTEFVYDGDGFLTSSSQRGGGAATALTVTHVVDAVGRIKKSTDPNGNEVRVVRDDFGRVISKINEMGADDIVVRTVYDLNDNVLSLINDSGGMTTYLYDEADRAVTVADEGATDETFAYDDAGNVVTYVDRNGTTTISLYDSRNQLTQSDYTLATNIVGPTKLQLWRDEVGRVTKAYNLDALVLRSWNTLSGLEKETNYIRPTNSSGAGATARDVDYVFDSSGRISLVDYPDDSHSIRRKYDEIGQVTKIEKKEGAGEWEVVTEWDMQGPGRPSEIRWGELDEGKPPVREELAYDEYGRVTELDHDRRASGSWEDLYTFRRGYDAGGRPEWERRDYYSNANPSVILSGERDFGDLYRYDSASRLTKVVRGVGYQATQSHSFVETAADTTLNFVTKAVYSLSDNGNRETLQLDSSNGSVSSQETQERHTYDSENQLSTRQLYTYLSGWTASGSQTTYSYDSNGNMVSSAEPGQVKVDVQNRIYEFGDWRYRYDPFGRRVEKRDTGTEDGYWRHFYYDGQQCIQEYAVHEHGAGGGDGEGCQCSAPTWTRVFGTYYVDQILWGRWEDLKWDCEEECEVTTQIQDMFVHLDFLFSVVAVTDDPSSGDTSILETYRYGEYGERSCWSSSGSSLSGTQYQQEFGFTGRKWDGELSCYYYRARCFNPTSGVFLARDLLASDAPLSPYMLAGNAPLDRTDPSGKSWIYLPSRRGAGESPMSFSCPFGMREVPGCLGALIANNKDLLQDMAFRSATALLVFRIASSSAKLALSHAEGQNADVGGTINDIDAAIDGLEDDGIAGGMDWVGSGLNPLTGASELATFGERSKTADKRLSKLIGTLNGAKGRVAGANSILATKLQEVKDAAEFLRRTVRWFADKDSELQASFREECCVTDWDMIAEIVRRHKEAAKMRALAKQWENFCIGHSQSAKKR